MRDVPAELPSPRDDDDDDVAWAMQTAQVQWQRGAYADAVTWLRRAADSALRIGATGRAWDLKLAASKLSALIPQNPPPSAPPGPPSTSRPYARTTLSQFPPPPAPYPEAQRSPSSSPPYVRSTTPPASAPFPPSSPPAALPYPQSQRAPSSVPFPPSSVPFPPSSVPFPPSSVPFPPSSPAPPF